MAKNNFYFWQLESIKDDPDWSHNLSNLPGADWTPLATTTTSHDDQLRPDLSPHPPGWHLPGPGRQHDRQGGQGGDRVRDTSGTDNPQQLLSLNSLN